MDLVKTDRAPAVRGRAPLPFFATRGLQRWASPRLRTAGGSGTVPLVHIPFGFRLRHKFAPPAGFRERLLAMVGNTPTAETVGGTAAAGTVGAGVSAASPGSGSGNGDEAPPAAFSTDIDMAELVEEHSDAVYRVALSVTRDPTLAEDVAQDALIKAWNNLGQYRGEAPLKNWILRITHNTAISALRRRREETRDPVDLPEQASHWSIESQVQNSLALDRFALALDDLDEVSRSIVVLREVEGLSYDEICQTLELTLPTVKTRLLRARRQLAIALEGWRP